LLTPDEVGVALGVPVVLRQHAGRSGPLTFEVNRFDGPDGSAVLTVMRSGGMIARMAMRAKPRS
jgi:hypothetical protein